MDRLLTMEETIAALGAEQNSAMAHHYRQEMKTFDKVKRAQDAKTLKAVGEWLKKYQLEDDEIQGIVGGVHIPNCDAGLQVLMRGEMPGTPEGG